MEEFKRLRWSWYKYEEDKKTLPRNLSFDTINDADALNRNLNEIHVSVLPNQDEYRLLKTPEEIAANAFVTTAADDGRVFVPQDPRTNRTPPLKSSRELVSCYSYLSELSKADQITILNALADKVAHNPRLLRKQQFKTQKTTDTQVPPQLLTKWQNEAIYFNKCAEIYFHRQVKELTGLFNDLSSLLVAHWNLQRNELKDYNYQAITMITRNTTTNSIVDIHHVADKSEVFNAQMYTISPESYFPTLQNYSGENVGHYLEQQRSPRTLASVECDLRLSLSTLAKLFVPGKEFIAPLRNDQNRVTNFHHNHTTPTQSFDYCEALEEAVESLLISHIDWTNVCKGLKDATEKSAGKFPCATIGKFMERVYASFKRQAGDNIQLDLWTIGNESQTFTVGLITRPYFARENVTAIISIKLEYQTNFGAEQMTKEELLKEWIQLKLTRDAVVMRYRVDVKSLTILSIQELIIEEVETELRELYDCNPHQMLHAILNLFRCLRNLPQGDYLIHAKKEGDCNKVVIYKEDANGKTLDDLKSPMQISQTFTRPWLPIDKRTMTFIHLNEFIAPSCFSYKAFNKSSYLVNRTATAVGTSAAVKRKLPAKKSLAKRKASEMWLRKSKRVKKAAK